MITTTVRVATEEDMPAIRELHGQIEGALGQHGKMDLPEVADPAVLEFFLSERDGQAVTGLYIEKCVEMCFVGMDPEGTAALREITARIFQQSAEAGVRFAHCLVPAEMAEAVGKHLEKSGFKATGFVHYRRPLQKEAN